VNQPVSNRQACITGAGCLIVSVAAVIAFYFVLAHPSWF